MVVHVVMVIEDVRHAERDRFHDAVGAVPPRVGEEGVMDKIVRDALQVPEVGTHNGNKRRYQYPPWQGAEIEKSPKDGRDNDDPAKGGKCIVQTIAEKRSKLEHLGPPFPALPLGLARPVQL